MKHTPLTTLLAVGAASAVALSTAFAQSSTTTTTTGTDGTTTGVSTSTGATTGVSSTTSTTSSLDGTGTITTYTPGQDYIQMRTETSTAPTRYYYSKKTTVVDPTGATVDMSLLRPDMPVRYTYVKDGDRMVISKITLEKPITEYTKETTTTTTTHKK
jgi:mucin-22